jgi:hypothetical protein
MEDIYELRVPRLQIVRGAGYTAPPSLPPPAAIAGVGGAGEKSSTADLKEGGGRDDVSVRSVATTSVGGLANLATDEGTGKEGKAVGGESAGGGVAVEGVPAEDPEEEKRVLRREIKVWWEGVADHLDKLVNISFSSHHVFSWMAPEAKC